MIIQLFNDDNTIIVYDHRNPKTELHLTLAMPCFKNFVTFFKRITFY